MIDADPNNIFRIIKQKLLAKSVIAAYETPEGVKLGGVIKVPDMWDVLNPYIRELDERDAEQTSTGEEAK